jgi:uncharacterized protein (TIGR03437 family)
MFTLVARFAIVPAALAAWYLAAQTSPSGVDGKPAAPPLPRPILAVGVTIGGRTAEVTYAGGTPGLVAGGSTPASPLEAPAGNAEVIVTVSGVPSQAGVTVTLGGN